jgi:endonuclease YncB( thermonuclease family)
MDLGFHVHIKVRCRLARVSAPELQTPEGKIAKGITAMWLPLGKIIYVISKSVDRYGRSIAEITVDGKNLTDGLIAERSDLFLPYK